MTLVLDHYLEVLWRQPGALLGAVALAQARAAGVFTAEHEAFWSAARRAQSDTAGTRELVEVLLLHRRHPHADVIAGIAAALSTGVAHADVVGVEVRRIGQDRATITDIPKASPTGRVVSLTQRRLADPEATIAAPDRRPPPTVSAYDDLLTRRSAPHRLGATSSEVS